MRYPYVGPRPFEQNDRGLFFGRDAEINELLSLVISHRAVLFYAESGAGKSSLINAGLIPELEKEGFEILPIVRVQGLLKETDPGTIDNLYVFNSILCLYGDLKERADHDHLKRKTLAAFLSEIERGAGRAGEKRARILIFDQFEELFTFYPERWNDRPGFFEQVSEAIEDDPLLRVIFTMREDYIAQLDPHVSSLPQNLRTRFRLERLREDAALEAVTRPLKGTNRAFAPGVDRKLVRELTEVRVETEGGKTTVVQGEFVEPVQLQVVCQTLWRALPPETITITEEDLKKFGDVDNALSKFYERAIKETVSTAGVREGELRRWFEQKLLTPSGTRSTVYRGQNETAGLSNAAVAELENMHIIRGERRGGAAWYELTHDRFIEPILQSNRRWLSERQSAEDTRQKLERQAAEWAERGRAGDSLLDEIGLRDARNWLASPEAGDLSLSETLLAFVEASRAALDGAEHEREVARAKEAAEEQRRIAELERRRATQLKLAMGLTVILALVAGAFAWKAKQAEREARIAEAEAREEKLEALLQRDLADSLVKAREEQAPQAAPPAMPGTPSNSLPAPSPSPLPEDRGFYRGYAYYGVKGARGWRVQYFKRTTGDANDLPADGELIETIQSVNARKGVIGYDNSDREWKGSALLGIINKGEKVRVLEVIQMDDYIWIQFERP
ncbi:MAG: hypothetical protein ACKVX9_15195 [Blastocatellia bacterium]